MSNWEQKFEKFRDAMMPYIEVFEGQRHMQAIRKAMVTLMPFTVLGSFTLVAINIAAWFPASGYGHYIQANKDSLMLLFNYTIGYLGVLTSVFVAYFLAEHYKLNTIGCAATSLIFFSVNSSITTAGVVSAPFVDAKGMFAAIIFALIIVEINEWFRKKRLLVRMPEGVPNFVARSFELLVPLIVTGFLAFVVRELSMHWTGKLIPELILNMLSPLVVSLDTVWGIVLINTIAQLLWWFGIHGDGCLRSVVLAPMMAFLAENMNAYAHGQPVSHLFTNGVWSAFYMVTGSGITLGLIIPMLFSKSERYRAVGKIAFIPSLFSVNEPVTFGVPIVYNPVLFFPFVIGNAILCFLITMVFYAGLVPLPFMEPPAFTPFPLQGFLCNMSWASVVLQFCIIGVSTLMYWPFFKIIEKQELALEQGRSEEK